MKTNPGRTIRWLLPSLVVIGLVTVALYGFFIKFPENVRTPNTHTQRIRFPALAFLSPASDASALWLLGDLQGGKPLRLSALGQVVSSFGVSPDGEQVVYSVKSQQGSDLWLVDRLGKEPRLFQNCGEDICTNPAWSPAGNKIAYIRQLMSPPSSKGLVQIWLVDLAASPRAPLLEDTGISGDAPAWSPDGRWLALVGSISKDIRIVSTSNGMTRSVRAQLPAIGGWSADSKTLYFADLDSGSLPSLGMAYTLNVESWEITPLFRQGPQPVDYAAPNPSPDGQWLAVGLRFTGASRQLWLLNENGDLHLVVGDDPRIAYGVSRWSPDGSQLAFQLLELGSSGSLPEIWIWDRGNGGASLAARNAFSPHWLP